MMQPSLPLLGEFAKQFVLSNQLIGRACNICRSALGFTFRLGDDTLKRRRSQETATHYADAAERISRIRTAAPASAAIMALEHYASGGTGGQ
jgi:hypothetical protein